MTQALYSRSVARSHDPDRTLARASPARLPDGVRLALCRIDTEADQPLAEAEGWLSTEERARAARLRGPGLRDRFVRARGFLRRELGAACGLPPGRLPLDAGPGGKPALGAGVAGPAFNLSHCGGLAVLALSQTGPVGIDIEFADRAIDPLALAPAVLTAPETALLAALSPPSRVARFLAFWTAREAFLKLTGAGLRRDPRSVALRLSDGWPVAYADQPARLLRPDIGAAGAICALALGPGEMA